MEESNKSIYNNESNNMKKTDLNDLLNAINNESKKENSNNKDLLDMNANSGNSNNKNEIIFKMNGQDLFSNFPSSDTQKKEEKEEKQKPKEDDLFTMFNKPEQKKIVVQRQSMNKALKRLSTFKKGIDFHYKRENTIKVNKKLRIFLYKNGGIK